MRRSVPVLLLFGILACGPGRQTASHDLGDGHYRYRTETGDFRPVYLSVSDSALALHEWDAARRRPQSLSFRRIGLLSGADSLAGRESLRRHSLDIDLTTILFKYRFRQASLPNQLNSNLNGAIYVGYRTDYFHLFDRSDLLGQRRRVVRQFQFDAGLFAGLGSSAITPSSTAGARDLEYDGVIFQKGVALFIGTRRFTLGLGLGTDALLDANRKVWIYQEKPWLGLMIGINLSE